MQTAPGQSDAASALALPFLLLTGGVAMAMIALALVLVQQRPGLTEAKRQMTEALAMVDSDLKDLTEHSSIPASEIKWLADGSMASQRDHLAVTQAKENEHLKQLTESRDKRAAAAEQAAEVQKKFNDLVLDLMILAKTDKDANGIVQKFNITSNSPIFGNNSNTQ